MNLKMFETLGVEANCRDESGLLGNADGIAFPKCTSEVQMALKAAAAAGVHVTVQGGKTGLCAGAVPDGGLILNLSRMTDILDFSCGAEGAAITVQAGVTLEQLQNVLQKKCMNTSKLGTVALYRWNTYVDSPGRLEFYPNPTEGNATLGGAAATAAVGTHILTQGTMADYILAMEVVGTDGTLWQVQNREMIRTVCGSEGALGAITALTLRLTPQPRLTYGLLCYFHTLEKLQPFFYRMRAQVQESGGAVLSAAEWFSASCGRVLEQEQKTVAEAALIPAFPESAAAAVWMEFSGECEDTLFDLLGSALEFLEEMGQFPEVALAATDDLNRQRLGKIRHVLIEIANIKSPCSETAPFDWLRHGEAGLACAAQAAERLDSESVMYILMGHLQSGLYSLRMWGSCRPVETEATVFNILKEFGCEFSQEHGCGRIKQALRTGLGSGGD